MLATARNAKEIIEQLREREGSWTSGLVRVAGTQEVMRGRRVSSGLRELDELLGGGLPCGRVVELFGAASSGRMSMVVAALAAATARDELGALIDPADGFDPVSAREAGVVLERVLWVRPTTGADALRAADLVTAAGGFGVVALYLCGVRVRAAAAAWARLARCAEKAGAALLVVGDERQCGTFAAASVEVRRGEARWQRVPAPAGQTLLVARVARLAVTRSRLGTEAREREVELGVTETETETETETDRTGDREQVTGNRQQAMGDQANTGTGTGTGTGVGMGASARRPAGRL